MAGWEGLYEVSEDGVVYRVGRGKGAILGPLKPYRLKNGYLTVYPSRDDRRSRVAVHHAVAEAFIGPRLGREVNHKNGIKTDNTAANLEYVTHQQNVEHATRLGLIERGAQRWNARLNEGLVRRIRQLHGNGVRQSEIVARLGLTRVVVNDVVRGRTWRWVA